jgi:NTE family protein
MSAAGVFVQDEMSQRKQAAPKQAKASVALVLGSGGARGYAHIGVIEEIERRGYAIRCVAGCSMGAIVGGMYAAGKLQPFRDWVSGIDYIDLLRFLDFGFDKLGAIRGERIFSRLQEIVEDVAIEDLPIPFTAVATDLSNQQEVWFQEGSLQEAMRASAAIPSVFAPVRRGGRVLVDGGLLNPLPINPVVAAHCDLVMAVNLNSSQSNGYELPVVSRPAPIRQQLESWLDSLKLERWWGSSEPDEEAASHNGPTSMLELVHLSFEAMQASLTRYKIAGYPPDVVFEVPKRVCRFFEFQRAPELIELGRMVATDTLDRFEAGAGRD